MSDFDDFLGLGSADFSRERLILFYGCSGSGKSTAIQFLIENHRDFSGQTSVVDEVLRFRDLLRVIPLLQRSGRSVVATHLNPMWFRLFFPFARIRIYRTDRDRAKTQRYLQRQGISASPQAIEAFVRRYGSTYTDADLILERFPSRNFDQALCRFEKFCRIELSKA